MQFSGLSYVRERFARYQYRLEGSNPEWKDAPNGDLDFQRLPSGDYRLDVKVTSGTGQESAQMASVSFRILAPWWQTWWFRAGLVLLLLVIGDSLWRHRMARHEAERLMLERRVSERTSELRMEKQRVEEEKVLSGCSPRRRRPTG